VVRLLLKSSKVDLTLTDKYGYTALKLALYFADEATIKTITEVGKVGLNTVPLGNPLCFAVQSRKLAIVKLIIELGGDVNSPDEQGCTALSWAAAFEYEDFVALLLHSGRADVEWKDCNGRTPLSLAIQGQAHHQSLGNPTVDQRLRIVRMLLGCGLAEPDSQDDRGRSPLLYAAWLGPEPVAELLLATGQVCASRRDARGRSPLSYAAESGKASLVRSLLRIDGVDPHETDCFSRSALHYAATNCKDSARDVAQLLLATKRIDVNQRDMLGLTPLSTATRLGNTEIVRLLLDYPTIDLDSADEYGRTALVLAALEGRQDIMDLLIEKFVQLGRPIKEAELPAAISIRHQERPRCFICLRYGAYSVSCDYCCFESKEYLCHDCERAGLGCLGPNGRHEARDTRNMWVRAIGIRSLDDEKLQYRGYEDVEAPPNLVEGVMLQRYTQYAALYQVLNCNGAPGPASGYGYRNVNRQYSMK
jgi:ankyrin repeat protein